MKARLALVALLLAAASARAADSPSGLWRFVDDDSVIEFSTCNGSADTLCAVLRKLPNAKALAALSAQQRREAPSWCGKPLVGALTRDEPDQWRGGWVYDPQTAQRYRATLKQTAPDQLELLAFVGSEWLSERMALEPWRAAAPTCP
ncbi:DUF2147 domain-containing protein [Chitinolyticbacter albus]|uniref:DUF2147 domain-containing protein n=1 Tax=Chitinolyticbacter albus TaxID=2961951 RepID=UPI0021095E0F|nr:DUF2147 domain-containing protein [Chitinolyticbacter albus]